jgi:hypothetical protein
VPESRQKLSTGAPQRQGRKKSRARERQANTNRWSNYRKSDGTKPCARHSKNHRQADELEQTRSKQLTITDTALSVACSNGEVVWG